jgi:TPR repeat protein
MKLGDASSMLKLGDSYEKGKRVNKDESKAFKYYRKSIKNGCNEPLRYLAYCNEIRIGAKQNTKRAITQNTHKEKKVTPFAAIIVPFIRYCQNPSHL